MAPGKKTGGRQRGSKNKRTLALEAEAAAAVAADGNPRAVPALTAILKHYLDKVAAEKAKPDGGDEAVISAALMEARITAAALAPYAGGAGLRFVRARAIFCNMARPNSVPERVLLAVLRRQKALGIGHATSAFSSCRHAAVHAQGCQGLLHAPFQPIVLAEVGLNPAQPQLGGIDPSAYLARR